MRALEAALRVLRKAGSDQMVQRRRSQRLMFEDWAGLLRQDRGDEARLTLALKRLPACRHFVDEGAKSKNVRPGINFSTFHLLRGHVLQGTENCPLDCQGIFCRREL